MVHQYSMSKARQGSKPTSDRAETYLIKQKNVTEGATTYACPRTFAKGEKILSYVLGFQPTFRPEDFRVTPDRLIRQVYERSSTMSSEADSILGHVESSKRELTSPSEQ